LADIFLLFSATSWRYVLSYDQTYINMKSLTKVLLVAALVTGAGHTFAYTHATAKEKTSSTVQDRHLSGFNAVEASGSFDIYIVQGATESVKVEAPSDMIDHIVTEVQDGVLKIHDKHGSSWNWGGNWWGGSHKKIAVYVSAKELNAIGITGSGDVYFKDGIRANSLKIRVTGSGDVLGRVEVKTLEAVISGSGDMKIYGHAQNSMVSVSGSGDLSAKGLTTENTTVRVSGSGDASINASNSIQANVSGSGDISYTGSAKNVSSQKSGSGDISRD